MGSQSAKKSTEQTESKFSRVTIFMTKFTQQQWRRHKKKTTSILRMFGMFGIYHDGKLP